MGYAFELPSGILFPTTSSTRNWDNASMVSAFAYDDQTHDQFTATAEEQNWSVGPLPPSLIVATALCLRRSIAF